LIVDDARRALRRHRGVRAKKRRLRNILQVLGSGDVKRLIVREADALRHGCRHLAVRSVDVSRNHEASAGTNLHRSLDICGLHIQIFGDDGRRRSQRIPGYGAGNLGRGRIEIEQQRRRGRKIIVGIINIERNRVRLAVAEQSGEGRKE